MKISFSLPFAAACCVALGSFATSADANSKSCNNRSNNNHKKLLECVTLDGVRAHQAAWQAIADVNGSNRFSGTPGYDASANYVYETLQAAGYDVELQPFTYTAYGRIGPSTLAQIAPGAAVYLEGTDYELMSQTDPGDVTGAVTGVDLALGDPATSTSGCEPADFAGFPVGHIALMQRGACTFRLKAENAAAAGAIGAIIFNQGTPGRLDVINGTLSADYSGGIPVMFATFDRGVEWAGTAGLVLNMVADVLRDPEALTFNVIAEKKGVENPDNVIMAGAHLDSVDEGPGIQDNGSGSGAILEVALQLAKAPLYNTVRFAWWGAEESGLIGSQFYVDNLTDEEGDKIALYLNFDMIGSPNYFFGIYDGDGSDFGLVGPAGSDAIEATFEQYYGSVNEPFQGSAFSGRSDYAAFIAVGIPAGGLFTGAEGIKTDEEAAIYGGTAGEQYDPCYHLACDTFDNISLKALDVNSDAVAYATLKYAQSTQTINGLAGKGNFSERKLEKDAEMAKFEFLGKKYQK